MGQTVLCFRLSKEKEQAVGIVCRKLGIRQRKVTGGEYNQKLGYLGELLDLTKNRGLLLRVRSLVRCWYSPDRLRWSGCISGFL